MGQTKISRTIPRPNTRGPRTRLLACALIALAALLAYADTFSNPFVFDDGFAIEKNPSIRTPWTWPGPLAPPAGLTVGGRPVLNLTFALNYAVSGLDVWSYHALNLLIHLAAALALFALLRRTLLVPSLRDRFGADATLLAAAVALLWAVHPLQTESVTYVSQRAESLMGLFYLVTIYSFIRAAEATARWTKIRWSAACVGACLLGMGTKEAMVTAPVMVLLYDRTFLAGTFREAWRQRARLHLALMATWLPLAWLLADVSKRPITLGTSPWHYALTQAGAITHYLTLVAWPSPLVIDYGTRLAAGPLEVWPQIVLVLALLGAMAWALVKRPVAGFAGAWFFLILAPTSSFIPLVLEPAAEHRLYLPLAAVLALAVLGLHRLIGRNSLGVVVAAAFILGLLTFLRNEDYRDPLTLWAQTVAAAPGNARAQNNYGEQLLQQERPVEAIAHFKAALALRPDYSEAMNNWGNALVQLGDLPQAIALYQRAARTDPTGAPAHNNWGNVLSQQGRLPGAMAQYAEAIRLDPGYVEAHFNYALALARAGQKEKALDEFATAAEGDPNSAEIETMWGSLLASMNRLPEAADHFTKAVQLAPSDPQAYNDLGVVYAQMGQRDNAVTEFRTALVLDPNYTPALQNLEKLHALPP